MDKEKIKKILICFSIGMVIILGIILVIGIYIFPVIIQSPNFPYCEVRNLNLEQSDLVKKQVSDRYHEEIYPVSKRVIEIEIQNISQIHDPNSKLDEIFRWEMHDWYNVNWESKRLTIYNNSPLFYVSEKDNSKLGVDAAYEWTLMAPRTQEGVFYNVDPYWLAYNKVGTCQSLSTLFAYMAQQSGFESRTVQTINHQWAEVKIDGKWMYYDPWCAREKGYYDTVTENFTFREKWFNMPQSFQENCLWYAYINGYTGQIIPNPIATADYL